MATKTQITQGATKKTTQVTGRRGATKKAQMEPQKRGRPTNLAKFITTIAAYFNCSDVQAFPDTYMNENGIWFQFLNEYATKGECVGFIRRLFNPKKAQDAVDEFLINIDWHCRSDEDLGFRRNPKGLISEFNKNWAPITQGATGPRRGATKKTQVTQNTKATIQAQKFIEVVQANFDIKNHPNLPDAYTDEDGVWFQFFTEYTTKGECVGFIKRLFNPKKAQDAVDEFLFNINWAGKSDDDLGFKGTAEGLIEEFNRTYVPV